MAGHAVEFTAIARGEHHGFFENSPLAEFFRGFKGLLGVNATRSRSSTGAVRWLQPISAR